jgi:hypothetical protein
LRAVLFTVALLFLSACGGPDETARLIERLKIDPGLEPPALTAERPVVLLELAVTGTTVVLPEPPVLQPGARLRLERALQARRTAAPTLWVVTVSPDGDAVRYWCAASDQARIRVTIPGERGTSGGRKRTEGALSSVRVPFEPGGQVRIYRASGGMLAAFRFGKDAEAPLESGGV